MAGIAELLPASAGDPDGPVSGSVFKIERSARGEKIAYVRMFSGTIHTRDRLQFGTGGEDKVTAIEVFERGPAEQRPSVSAGAVARLWGLAEVKIGDRIGDGGTGGAHQFPPPTLEAVVVAAGSGDGARLHTALAQLAEQDPLIDVRQDDHRRELSVSLYGEVQKEVLQSTLVTDFGLDVAFRETTPICVERPTRTGQAAEVLHADSNPFRAAMGLRVEPAPEGSGVDFRLEADARTVPLYLYKTLERFTESMAGYVRRSLREGIFGWQVTDCVVTMTSCTYCVPDGPPSRRGPLSTAADFRKLTPIVVMRALEQAAPVVCEPVLRVGLEVPAHAIGAVIPALVQLGAAVDTPSLGRDLATIETALPAARLTDLQRRLARLTGGEGLVDAAFDGYRPVSGAAPTRRRTTPNPLDLEQYKLHLSRRASTARE
jgi:ribosomal protection tetracycline resistance protein